MGIAEIGNRDSFSIKEEFGIKIIENVIESLGDLYVEIVGVIKKDLARMKIVEDWRYKLEK